MTEPEDHDRTLPLLAGAFERPPAEREAWLEQACPDPALRARVRAMVAREEADTDFLESGATPAFLAAGAASAEAGQRLGPWRLERPLGSGGMGEVWLGERADGAFAMRVAVKLLRFGVDPRMAERFRLERQVLADLDHPGVARLLDGGVTDAGTPYLVLEYVEGRPIDVFCREEALDTDEILRLFLAVCEAVQHAHARLVVHRDVKPANVLVSGGGEPKLLDFGIARLLSGGDGATRPLDRLGTPRYASPEQVLGQPVSTATDVYSLGALLYHLLAGRPPLALDSRDAVSWPRTIAEEDPPPASEVAPPARRARVAGDLDAILARALRKDARERYASVEAFAADVRRHRRGEPVAARPDSFGYRFRKLVRRNPLRVAAALLLAAILFAWGGTATWQYLRTSDALDAADAERIRAVAAEERARGTLTVVEDYARAMLFEVHDEILRLPGATRARERLVGLTIEHLETLANDAADDPSLARYLAESYQRLGEVQGASSFGDAAAALGSFRASKRWLAVAERGAAVPPAEARTWRAQLDLEIGSRQADLGDTQAAQATLDRAQEGRLDTTVAVDRPTIAIELQRGDMLATAGRSDEAIALFRRVLDQAEAGVAEGREPEREWRRDRALARQRLANALHRRARLVEAEQLLRDGLADFRALTEEWPADVQLAADLAHARESLGAFLVNARRYPEARVANEEACAAFLALVEADGHDVSLRAPLARCLCNLASSLWELGEREDALAVARDAVGEARRAAEGTGENPQVRLVLGNALHLAGRFARVAGDAESAREFLAEAEALAAALPEGSEVRQLRADVASQRGYDALKREDPSAALGFFDAAFRHYGEVLAADPDDRYCARSHMVARSCMGVAARAAADTAAAGERRLLFEEARDAFAWTLERHAELEARGFTRSSDARAAALFRADLEAVEQALAEL